MIEFLFFVARQFDENATMTRTIVYLPNYDAYMYLFPYLIIRATRCAGEPNIVEIVIGKVIGKLGCKRIEIGDICDPVFDAEDFTSKVGKVLGVIK